MKTVGAVLGVLLLAFAMLFLGAWCAVAQVLDPGALKQLAAKAKESTNISLDQSMLEFAGMFLDKGKSDQAEVAKLVAHLKGVYVHSFEFAQPGDYSDADMAALRAALKEPEWSRVIESNSSGKAGADVSEIYFKKEGGKIGGVAVIAAEPKELTFVEIVGDINPEDIAKLSGQMGIPNLPSGANASAKKPDDK